MRKFNQQLVRLVSFNFFSFIVVGEKNSVLAIPTSRNFGDKIKK
jgi:hypothetical protein